MGRIKIGIEEKDRKQIVLGLSKLLADSYLLYIRTQNFHWNVTGPMFSPLHALFETQYLELAIAVDLIAERIRALGFPTPATYSEFIELATIEEVVGIIDSEKMLELLEEGQEVVIRTARQLYPLVNKLNDLPTADLLTQRMHIHEKMAWMLRSTLDGHTS